MSSMSVYCSNYTDECLLYKPLFSMTVTFSFRVHSSKYLLSLRPSDMLFSVEMYHDVNHLLWNLRKIFKLFIKILLRIVCLDSHLIFSCITDPFQNHTAIPSDLCSAAGRHTGRNTPLRPGDHWSLAGERENVS